MKNTQLLLINDMCGYGKVALSAMLPVLSHMGYRIHNLPTALVSDTLNYPKFYIHDTTEYVRQSLAIWEELGFEFDAISTGFIVTEEEARIISDFCHRRSQKGTKVFVDPIMADNGRLYAGVPESTIGLMRSLVECADYAVPNYTEACLLTDTAMAEQITADEARAVVITSAKVDGASAVIGYDHVAGEYFTIPFELIPVYFPGTGDTFSSVLVGRVMAGWSLQRATTDAMRVVAELIENGPLGAPRGKRPRIRVSCVDQLGACRCHHGHKPGDVFDFDRDRGKMCAMACHVGFPYIDILRYGGTVPGNEPGTAKFCCPEVDTLNVWLAEIVDE